MKASHACDKEHPKPNENVDLLVNNIEWKHTKAVEFLFSGGSTNAMKCTTEMKKMRNFFFGTNRELLIHACIQVF